LNEPKKIPCPKKILNAPSPKEVALAERRWSKSCLRVMARRSRPTHRSGDRQQQPYHSRNPPYFYQAGLALGTPGSASWAFTKTADGYLPNSPLELDEETGEKLAGFIEALEELDDVVNIYTAADTPEE
jgi:hypothetical protein